LETVKVEAGSGNSQLTTNEAAVSSVPQNLHDQMQEYLKVLSEETLQLSELLWQEEKLTKEFCALLKHVLNQLDMSFNLPTNVFPERGRIQQIILNQEAHVILINDKNEVESKALQNYPAPIIHTMASSIIPELSKSLTSQRQKIAVRIDFFDKVNRELKNLCNTSENHGRKLEEESTTPVSNGVKEALLNQQEKTETQ